MELSCLFSPGSSLEVAVVRGVVVELGRQGDGLDEGPVGTAVPVLEGTREETVVRRAMGHVEIVIWKRKKILIQFRRGRTQPATI